MSKSYKSFIFFFIIIIAVLLYFLKMYNEILQKEQTDTLVSKNIEIINNEISYQKKYALSLAILFSKNETIINNLYYNNREKTKQELVNLLDTISDYTSLKNIQVQVHTRQLEVFVRSWEDKDTGMNLESFRKGLVKVKKTLQPYVSNELGKRFNIKAISPVFKEGTYIGSIEIITDYTLLKSRLKPMGIDTMPILNKKFLNIAKYHRDNKPLFDFVVIDDSYDKKLFDLLSHNKEILKMEKSYYSLGQKIVAFIPLGHKGDEVISYLVSMFDKKEQNFNYLPNYEYPGSLPKNGNVSGSFGEKEKREIIIK